MKLNEFNSSIVQYDFWFYELFCFHCMHRFIYYLLQICLCVLMHHINTFIGEFKKYSASNRLIHVFGMSNLCVCNNEVFHLFCLICTDLGPCSCLLIKK